MRQPISGLVELAIRHRPARAGQRRRLGGAGRLRGEQHRDRHRRDWGPAQHRPVTPPIQPSALTGVKQIHRREPPRRVGGHGRQHPLNRAISVSMFGSVENIGVEFDSKTQLSPGRTRIVSG